MRISQRYRPSHITLAILITPLLLLIAATVFAQDASPPANARGVIRLRVQVKTGDTTKRLSRKRFFLVRGTLEQNKDLVRATQEIAVPTRDCFYRGIGASEALRKWLRQGDCESVYCHEIETNDLEGNDAVPEFQRAFAAGEREFSNRELARKWLTVNLAENIRDGLYKARQHELLKLIQLAEQTSGSKVLSVMTDTKGTAFFTELPIGTYVVSNLLPTETGDNNIWWNCEIQVKPGDLANEKAYLVSNTRERTVKCVGVEKPLPVCPVNLPSGNK